MPKVAPQNTAETSSARQASESQQFANFRMYHQLQYERIDKLEARREFFSNFVITLSTAIYALGLGDLSKLNVVSGAILPFLIILMNIVAIIFIRKSRIFTKMHQERAKEAREEFAPELNRINKKVGKHYSGTDIFRREMLYIYLHISISVITFCAAIYLINYKKFI